MSPLLATFSPISLRTVLDLLVPLLLTAADGNVAEAFNEALAMLDDFHPATREELFLAGEVISFRLKGLGALRDSGLPGSSPAVAREMLKLGNALRRSEAGAQRKLDALQRARRKAAAAADAPAETAPPPPDHQPAPDTADHVPPASPRPASPKTPPASGHRAVLEAATAAVMQRIGDDPALLAQLHRHGLPARLDDPETEDGIPPLPAALTARPHPATAAAATAGAAL